jgi:hypothetical protein
MRVRRRASPLHRIKFRIAKKGDHMHPRRQGVIRTGLVKATGSPTSLTILAAGLTLAFICAHWPIVGFTVAAYLAAVAIQLSRAELWRRVLAEQRAQAPFLPAEITLFDHAARAFTVRMTATRVERGVVLAAFFAALPEADAPWFDDVIQLERRAVTLIEELDRLGRYLARQDVARTRPHLLRRQDAGDRFGAAAADRRWAFSMAHERALSITELHAFRGRLHARLEAVIRTLELLPPRLVHLSTQVSSALEAGRDQDLLGDLAAELSAPTGDADARDDQPAA